MQSRAQQCVCAVVAELQSCRASALYTGAIFSRYSRVDAAGERENAECRTDTLVTLCLGEILI